MSSSSGRAFIVKIGKWHREGSPRFKSHSINNLLS